MRTLRIILAFGALLIALVLVCRMSAVDFMREASSSRVQLAQAEAITELARSNASIANANANIVNSILKDQSVLRLSAIVMCFAVIGMFIVMMSVIRKERESER